MEESAKFAEEIELLKSENASSSTGYRVRLALLGLLGYGFLVFVLLMVAGSVTILFFAAAQMHLGWVFLKLFWLPLVVAGIVVKSLWVSIPEPRGLELERKRYPALFEILDEVRGELRSPQIHRVVLTREFNASIAQVPRLGVLGWPRNTLSLGLPLMMALGPDSFRAVIAHEMGHLSGNHGVFGAWIFRIRRTWVRVLQGLEQQEAKLDFGLRRFFRWYAPYFEAYSFKLARAQEYVADACAAEVTSPRQACEALVEVAVFDAYVQFHVSRLPHERVKQEAAPPPLFREIRQLLQAGPPPDRANRALAAGLRQRAGPNDTHPSLSDRLVAMDREGMKETGVTWPTRGADLAASATADRSVAETLLGPELNGFVDQFDQEWCSEAREQWERDHRAFLKRLADLEELERAALERELTEDEKWKRICETVEFRSAEAALEILRPFAESYPATPQVRFLLGRLLLQCEGDAGIGEIEAAMENDPRAIPPGCELIEAYLLDGHREAEAAQWRQRAKALLQTIEAGRLEREQVNDGDPLLPHELVPEVQKELQKLFASLPLRRVMMARKQVEHFPASPVWVLGYSVRARAGMTRSWDLEAKVTEGLQKPLESLGDVIFFALESRPELAKALERVESSLLFPEEPSSSKIAGD
jgi:Zn-dependent protease with chaperone function